MQNANSNQQLCALCARFGWFGSLGGGGGGVGSLPALFAVCHLKSTKHFKKPEGSVLSLRSTSTCRSCCNFNTSSDGVKCHARVIEIGAIVASPIRSRPIRIVQSITHSRLLAHFTRIESLTSARVPHLPVVGC
jgi:hypothetical protein